MLTSSEEYAALVDRLMGIHPELKQAALSPQTLLTALNAHDTNVSNRLLDMGAFLDDEACDTFVEEGGGGGLWRALLFEPTEAHVVLADRLIASYPKLKQAAQSTQTLLAALRDRNSNAAFRSLDMGGCLGRESSGTLTSLCGDGGDWRMLLFDTSCNALCDRLESMSPELNAATTSPDTLLAALEAGNSVAANRLLDKGALLDEEACQTFIGSGQNGGWQKLLFNPSGDSVALADRLVESSPTLRNAAKSPGVLLAALEARDDVILAANRLMDLGSCLDDKTRATFIGSGSDAMWQKLLLHPSNERIALADRLMESSTELKEVAMSPQTLLAALDAHQDVAVTRLLGMGAFLDEETSAEFIDGNDWRSALLDSSAESIDRTDRLMEVSPQLREAAKSAKVLLAALEAQNLVAANRLLDLGALLDEETMAKLIGSDGNGRWQSLALDCSIDATVLSDRLMLSSPKLKEAALSPRMLLAALNARQCEAAHRLLDLGTILDETALARFTESKNGDRAWRRLLFNDSDECVALCDRLMKLFPKLREVAVSAETLLEALDVRNAPAANRLMDMDAFLDEESLATFRGSSNERGWQSLLFDSLDGGVQLSSRLLECMHELREDAMSVKFFFAAIGARNHIAAHRLLDVGARLDEGALATFIEMGDADGGWQKFLFSSDADDKLLADRLMELYPQLKDAAVSAKTFLAALEVLDAMAAIRLMDMGASLDEKAQAGLIGVDGHVGCWTKLIVDPADECVTLTNRLMETYPKLREATISIDALLSTLEPRCIAVADRILDMGTSLDDNACAKFCSTGRWRQLLFSCDDECVAVVDTLVESCPVLRDFALSPKTLLAALEACDTKAATRLLDIGAVLDEKARLKFIGSGGDGAWRSLLFSEDANLVLAGRLADLSPELKQQMASPEMLLLALKELKTVASHWLLDAGARADEGTLSKLLAKDDRHHDGGGPWRSLVLSSNADTSVLVDRMIALHPALGRAALVSACEHRRPELVGRLLDNGVPFDDHAISALKEMTDSRPPNLAFSDFLKLPGARVHESAHPYPPADSNTHETVHVEGAVALYVFFDERSCMNNDSDDFVRFYKSDAHTEYWGDKRYDSEFPGCNRRPPLRIPAEHFVLHFKSNKKGPSTRKWGYKFVVVRGTEVSFWTAMILDSSCSGLVERLMELSPELRKIAGSGEMLFTTLMFLNVNAALRVLDLGAQLDQAARTALVEAGFHVWHRIMYTDAWIPLVDRLVESYPELRDVAFSTEMLLSAIRDRETTLVNRILDKRANIAECLEALLATDFDTRGDSKRARHKAHLKLQMLVDGALEEVKRPGYRVPEEGPAALVAGTLGDDVIMPLDTFIAIMERGFREPMNIQLPRKTRNEIANMIQPTGLFTLKEVCVFLKCATLMKEDADLSNARSLLFEETEDDVILQREVGARVETRRGRDLIHGIVCRDYGDGNFDVDFDDGSFQPKISQSSIQPVKSDDIFNPDLVKLVLDGSPSCVKVVHRLVELMPSLKQPMLAIAVLKANVAASGRLLNLGAVIDEAMRKALLTGAGWKRAISEKSGAGLVEALVTMDPVLGPDAVLNSLRTGRYGLALRLIRDSHVPVDEQVFEGLRQLRGRTSIWHLMVAEENNPDVNPVIKELSTRLPVLLDIRDGNNRLAYAIGTTEAREVMRVVLFCGRYRVSTPLHTSATCRVLVANDMSHEEERLVVVKLMLNRDQFEREVSARRQGIGTGFVVPIVQSSDDETVRELWPKSVQKLGFPDYRYGIIMEYADRNLDAIMRQVRSIIKFNGK